VGVTSSTALLQQQQQQQQQQPAHPQLPSAAAGGGDEVKATATQIERDSLNLGEAKQLALDLMKQHGLGDEWTFSFNSRKRSSGMCIFGYEWISERCEIVPRNRIQLSTYFVTCPGVTRAHITDTILHEIAHAR
jgi:hypothetical protein